MSSAPRLRRLLRRVLRWRVLLLVLVVVIGWCALGVWQLLSARDALVDGSDELRNVRGELRADTLFEPTTDDAIDRAEADFEAARGHLRSPLVTPLRALPVIGRQVRAADRVERSARSATDIAGDAMTDLRELRDRGAPTGPARVVLIRDLSELVTRSRDRIAAIDAGSPDALVRPLHDAIVELHQERDDAVEGLDRAGRTTTALADLLEGPGTYLLFGANNAEMRAGSGMFLSAAPVEIGHGALGMGDVRPVGDLVLPEGEVAVEGDLARNWPWLDPGRDPRQLGLTPDFPQSAAVAAAWWEQVPGGGKVDGVISLDVGAVRELLRVVGPVEIDGVRYAVDTADWELLSGQYRRAGDSEEATEARRDRLGAVARAVFEKVEAGDWELDELASTMVELVQRRHLLVWSADTDMQAAWAEAGVAGALQEDSIAVSLLNRAGNKLDPDLSVRPTLTTAGGRLAFEITVTNDASADGPRYQVGPNAPGLRAGDHRAILLVNLPAGSGAPTVEGARVILRSTDGPTEVVAADLEIARGETVTVRIVATAPEGLRRIVREPSARLPGTEWVVDGRTVADDRRESLPVAGR